MTAVAILKKPETHTGNGEPLESLEPPSSNSMPSADSVDLTDTRSTPPT
jgi:hypothetical protein